MDRQEVLEQLFEKSIKGMEDEKEKANEYIDMVLESENIPEEVETFINNDPLNEYKQEFLERMSSKKFLKNFQGIKELDEHEIAKAISSMITHALIDIEHENVSSPEELMRSLNLDKYLEILNKYIRTGKMPDDTQSYIKSYIKEVPDK